MMRPRNGKKKFKNPFFPKKKKEIIHDEINRRLKK